MRSLPVCQCSINLPIAATSLTCIGELASPKCYQQVLAVTGSNGKPFKDALKHLFARQSVVASPGSIWSVRLAAVDLQAMA